MNEPKRSGSLPFVVSTGLKKADPATRKLIRSHVMLGKNRGKSRRAFRPTAVESEQEVAEHGDWAIKPLFSQVPQKVGTDVSFVQPADTIDAPVLAVIFKFSSMAKKVLFPLEGCIGFDHVRDAWFKPLFFDAIHLHSMAFTTHTYVDLASGFQTCVAGQGASYHFSRTIQLLRQRMALSDEQEMISDSTIMAVMGLAGHALMVSDYRSAEIHLKGLRRIVNLRGGITAFQDRIKLVIEILRCDINLALQSGKSPFFLAEDFVSTSYLPYPEHPDSFLVDAKDPLERENSIKFLENVDCDVSRVWKIMDSFSSLVNRAADAHQKLPQDVLLSTMTSAMYPLLRAKFDHGSLDETIRLGLLVFCSSVFLKWEYVKMPHKYLTTAYRQCLSTFNAADVTMHQLFLWLLAVGSISIFTDADEEWVRSMVRANIARCNVESWVQIREVMKTFLWVDILHDKEAKKLFDSLNSH